MRIIFRCLCFNIITVTTKAGKNNNVESQPGFTIYQTLGDRVKRREEVKSRRRELLEGGGEGFILGSDYCFNDILFPADFFLANSPLRPPL